ncbi:MAG TPA: hypothetical protein VJ914_11675 [Pseudonocardiaceae bacterium]|nr:hypothetical protein [Pseudonocardiaceae bacterium]
MGVVKAAEHGTMLAFGIVFLWLGGFCLFIALMSGKISALSTGTDSSGKPQGPKDVSQLATSLAQGIQAQETGPTNALTAGIGGPVNH